MGPTDDRSASGAMVRKIIRRVNMNAGLPPKQQKFVNTSMSTLIMFKGWRNATQNSCAVNTTTNPGHNNCISDPKNSGKCGC
jgi:hypothetical protein